MKSTDTYNGDEIDLVVSMYRDGHVIAVSPTPEIIAAVSARTVGVTQVDTSMRVGLTYDHAKLLCMIRNPGIRLAPGTNRSIRVCRWAMYPVDVPGNGDEIVTIDRLVIETQRHNRYYTDDQHTIDAWLYQLFSWTDDPDQWPILEYPT